MPDHAADLLALGVDANTAASLAARYSPSRVREVARAARGRARHNPAGWTIRALEGGWEVTDSRDSTSMPAPSWQPPATPAHDSSDVEQRWQAWDQAVSATLDDGKLARAVALARSAFPPASHIGPAIRAQVVHWAIHALQDAGTDDLHDALSAALGRTPAPMGPYGRRGGLAHGPGLLAPAPR